MSSSSNKYSQIGILEKTEPWKLQSHFFPSKVGGKPAWLDLKHIPNTSVLTCDECHNPLTFLCQIYAPVEEDPNAFHRTLFIFICKNVTCNKVNQVDNMRILRCQLPRDNIFYSFQPPDENNSTIFHLDKWPPVCHLCGLKAPSHCSKCKKVNYCHRSHQVYDWKNGHKAVCENVNSNSDTSNSVQVKNSFLFPEWDLELEDVPEDEKKTVVTAEEMEKFQELMEENKAGSFYDVPESDIEPYAASAEDKIFNKFNKVTSQCPDQVLRYSRGGVPLWITGNPDPPAPDVPHCDYCGAYRHFEFQIMPQLLNFLDLKPGPHSIDWGVLMIFTCSKSCNDGPSYKKEVLYKQDIV